jgi:uncharacterized membrane protein
MYQYIPFFVICHLFVVCRRDVGNQDGVVVVVVVASCAMKGMFEIYVFSLDVLESFGCVLVL